MTERSSLLELECKEFEEWPQLKAKRTKCERHERSPVIFPILVVSKMYLLDWAMSVSDCCSRRALFSQRFRVAPGAAGKLADFQSRTDGA